MTPVHAPTTALDARYRALAEVASVLAAQVEMGDLLKNLRGLIEPLITFEFLAVYLRDEGGDTLTLRMKESRIEAVLPPPPPFALVGSLPGEATLTGMPVYVSRVDAHGPPPSERLVRHQIASFCAVPLTTPRRALGALAVGSMAEDAYSTDEVDFLVRVGRLVAAAIENAQNLDTVRRQQAAIASERDRLDSCSGSPTRWSASSTSRRCSGPSPRRCGRVRRRCRVPVDLRRGGQAPPRARLRPAQRGRGGDAVGRRPVARRLAGRPGVPRPASRASSACRS